MASERRVSMALVVPEEASYLGGGQLTGRAGLEPLVADGADLDAPGVCNGVPYRSQNLPDLLVLSFAQGHLVPGVARFPGPLDQLYLGGGGFDTAQPDTPPQVLDLVRGRGALNLDLIHFWNFACPGQQFGELSIIRKY